MSSNDVELVAENGHEETMTFIPYESSCFIIAGTSGHALGSKLQSPIRAQWL